MSEIFPILAFVGGYVGARYLGYQDIAMYVATSVLMIACLLQLVWMKLRKQTIEKRHWVSVLVVLVLGGITLIVKNDLFIKLKPTVINFVFAIAFLGSQFVGKEVLAKRLMGSFLEMSERIWTRVNLAWVGFFVVEGVMNAIVALVASNDFYVSFKLWGLLLMSFVFMGGMLYCLRGYLKEEGKK